MTEHLGDPILVLEQQHVARASGSPLDLALCGEQHLGRRPQTIDRRVEDAEHIGTLDRHRPAQRLDVQQTAAATFQVRFEEGTDVTGLRPAFDGRVAQTSQPPVGTTVPEHERLLLDLVGGDRVT